MCPKFRVQDLRAVVHIPLRLHVSHQVGANETDKADISNYISMVCCGYICGCCGFSFTVHRQDYRVLIKNRTSVAGMRAKVI